MTTKRGVPDGFRRFTFMMDEDMYLDLKALADHCDGTVSGLVRDALYRMLRQYYAFGGQVRGERRTRETGAPRADA